MDCAVDDTNGLAKRIPLFDSWESTPRAHWVSRAFHHFLYESIAARIRQHLARRKNVEEKKMFGGVGFLLHGNMLVGVWKDSLIARLGSAGKAAPAYRLAKLIIMLINNVAGTINGDPLVRGRLKVLFLPEYNVSLAERLIPASDVSEQISTAGYEASGTGNMKFMMNGALTIGTRDGATIEMAQEAGEENFFLFGLTAQQVADSQGWYDPAWHYANEPETRAALDLIYGDFFNRNEPGVFNPIRDTLRIDHYMHLADLTAYANAHKKLAELYADPEAWSRRAVINVACSGKFSSDRTIQEYADEIWDMKPSPVP